jgi:murein DD-endopeptidase MepM/ murein hydrolase activator NlpD
MALSTEIFNTTREDRLFLQGEIAGKGKPFDNYQYTYNVKIVAGNATISETVSEHLKNIPVMGLDPGIDPGLEEGEIVNIGFVDKDMSFPIMISANTKTSGGYSGGYTDVDFQGQPPEYSLDCSEFSIGAENLLTTTLVWPTPSCTIITSVFGKRKLEGEEEERYHDGIDIGAASQANIVAAHDGTVVQLNKSTNNHGYGRYVDIRSSNGIRTRYGHGYQDSVSVSLGDTVIAGQVIMKVGGSGSRENSYLPHLHFEVGTDVNGSFKLINPRQCTYFINGIEAKGRDEDLFPVTGSKAKEIWVENWNSEYSSATGF